MNISTAQNEDLYRKPLVGDDMRLIRIHSGAWDDDMTCDLRHWEAHERPEYYALSYAWGDMTNLVPITLNDRTEMIGHNLHAALRQFRETMRTASEDPSVAFMTETHDDFWLWTDSLCLNQASDDEKQVQVPRMGEIYRGAKDVLGWLGELDTIDTADMRVPVEVCRVPVPDNNVLGAYYRSDYKDRLRAAISSRLEPLLRSLHAVLSRPFFERVWIIQEMALARHDPILVVGRHYFRVLPLCTLYYFVRMEGDLAESDAMFTMTHAHCLVFSNIRHFYQMENSPVYKDGRRDAVAVAWRLNICLSLRPGQFKSARAHDHLYSMLGFLGGCELPDTVRPDYSRPFEQVYTEYARFCLEHTAKLFLLDRNRRSLRDAPSWVPDYRHSFHGLQTNMTRKVPSPDYRPTSHRFLDKRRLQVQGVSLQGCVAVVASHEATAGYDGLDDDDFTWCVKQTSKLRDFVDKVVQLTALPAEEVVDQILDICFTPMKSLVQDRGPRDALAQSLLRGGGEESLWDEKVWFSVGVLFVIANSWVVTGGGVVGHLRRLDVVPRVGDVVCAVQGFEPLVLLRRRQRDDEYEFLGAVREWGLGGMVKSDDETYWEGKQLQKFTLV